MKNTFGQALTLTLFGESHGDTIGAVLDGIAPGIMIDHGYIEEKLTLRRPFGKISTARQEADQYNLISGVFEGKTTGAPLTVLIPNENKKSDEKPAADNKKHDETPDPAQRWSGFFNALFRE